MVERDDYAVFSHTMVAIDRPGIDEVLSIRDMSRSQREAISDVLFVARMNVVGLADVDGDGLPNVGQG